MNQRTLHWMHFSCSLLMPLMVVFLLSCKQAHEERADLGPQATDAQIEAVLSKAIRGVSIERLQVGQRLHYQESLRIANQDPNQWQSDHDIRVIARNSSDDTQDTRITIHHSLSYRENNDVKNVESEDTFSIPDATMLLNRGMLQSVSATISATMNVARVVRVTYHNLRSSEGNIEPPPKVRDRGDCGGLSPCRIHVTFLSYDEVHWFDDNNYAKLIYDFAFTPQLPYMGGLIGAMVTGCVGLYGTVDGKTYFLRDCKSLTDIQK